MIFKDIVSYKKAKLSAEFDRLIEYAWKNKSHVGNLLLLYVNGFYRDKTQKLVNLIMKNILLLLLEEALKENQNMCITTLFTSIGQLMSTHKIIPNTFSNLTKNWETGDLLTEIGP